jgi:hypothetical protein
MIILSPEARAWHESAMRKASGGGKNISHGGNSFSQVAWEGIAAGVQRAGKLHTQKMIVIQMRHPNRPCAKDAGGIRQPIGGSERNTWNFQRNQCRFGQGAADDNQSSACGDINSSSKFKRILAVSILGAYKNRNGKLQTCRLSRVPGLGLFLHFPSLRKLPKASILGAKHGLTLLKPGATTLNLACGAEFEAMWSSLAGRYCDLQSMMRSATFFSSL